MKENLIYKDDEVEVYAMPTHNELKEILIELLKRKGALRAKDAHKLLPFPVSEEKIRQILDELVKEKIAEYDYKTKRYALIG